MSATSSHRVEKKLSKSKIKERLDLNTSIYTQELMEKRLEDKKKTI